VESLVEETRLGAVIRLTARNQNCLRFASAASAARGTLTERFSRSIAVHAIHGVQIKSFLCL
jgi:hypothetical protein